MAIYKKSTPKKSETKIVPDEKDGMAPFVEKNQRDDEEQIFFEEGADAGEPSGSGASGNEVGQLALDVFQTDDAIVVVAPVAGVQSHDLAINITDEVLTIKGRRDFQFTVSPNDYFTRECFWGDFSRSIILPESVDASGVTASFKNGVLTVSIPKVEKIRTRMVHIKEL